jgi:DNA modification methylase
VYRSMQRNQPSTPRGDVGSAARFFYCAKTSKQDRDEGISDPEKDFVQFQTGNGSSGRASSISAGRQTKYRNIHPTVKPTALMRYLCRLVTPRGGVVLDPFLGSGSTGKAAVLEQYRFIGIEISENYINIARQRIDHARGALFAMES